MDHESIKTQLMAFYDGELDPLRRREVEEHIGHCPECRETCERWARAAKILFKRPEAPSGDFFVRRVMDRVWELEAQQQTVGWSLLLKWFVPAAGLALVLMALLPSMPLPLSLEALLVNTQDVVAPILSDKTVTMDEALLFVMGG